MVKRLFWKAPSHLAVFALVFALAFALTGCDGTGSGASNNNNDIVNGGNNNGGGGNDNNGNNGGGGNNGNGQQPPANEFTFGGETTPLLSAAFNEWDWGLDGFAFLLSTAEPPHVAAMNILIDIPDLLMGELIDLSKYFYTVNEFETWSIVFHHDGPPFGYYGDVGPLPEGTMQVTHYSNNRFRIEVEGILGGEEFSLHFYGEFTPEQNVWDIANPNL